MGGDEKKGRKISKRVFPGLGLLEDLLIWLLVESYSRQWDREWKVLTVDVWNTDTHCICHLGSAHFWPPLLRVCSLARDATHMIFVKTRSSITRLPNSYRQKMKISVPPSATWQYLFTGSRSEMADYAARWLGYSKLICVCYRVILLLQ